MLVFLDFEASSLGKRGYPIEVAWVFEDGDEETYLIRPAEGWDDWDPTAAAIHGIARETLLTEGEPHDVVAQRMVTALSGHELFASAPSWDGKWLSALLRAAGLPRHSLRLRDTEEAWAETARRVLMDAVEAAVLEATVDEVVASTLAQEGETPPAHRALADARVEQRRWLAVRDAARARAAGG